MAERLAEALDAMDLRQELRARQYQFHIAAARLRHAHEELEDAEAEHSRIEKRIREIEHELGITNG